MAKGPRESPFHFESPSVNPKWKNELDRRKNGWWRRLSARRRVLVRRQRERRDLNQDRSPPDPGGSRCCSKQEGQFPRAWPLVGKADALPSTHPLPAAVAVALALARAWRANDRGRRARARDTSERSDGCLAPSGQCWVVPPDCRRRSGGLSRSSQRGVLQSPRHLAPSLGDPTLDSGNLAPAYPCRLLV